MIMAERKRGTRNTGLRESKPAQFIAVGLVASVAALGAAGTANAQLVSQTASAVTEQLFDSVNSSVCTISAIATDGSYLSRGSGFVLRGSGLLVTNAHVVAGLRQATAKCDGQQFNIRRIVKFDKDIDLAVGEIGAADVPGLTLSTGGHIRPGSQIYVFGSPYGLEGTMTPGLASGKRVLDGRTYLQVSAPIGAGNSGGPVTDQSGAVIGVAVASLDEAQNITFAIPASVIAGLPDVDMQTVELAAVSYEASTAAPVVQQAPPSRPVRPVVAAGSAAFRGNSFGAPCGDVAVTEYERQRPMLGTGKAAIKFTEWYSGNLELDVDLLGTPATVVYDCDARLGMTSGYYLIHGNTDGVDKIENVLRSKYGSGIVQQISEVDASQRGCTWNFSIPGSRNFRASKWTTWRVDDRFHIDLLECGGRSKLTLLSYSDPVLVSTASRTGGDGVPSDRPRFEETDL
jgi:S1-C subfamily serine protease